MHLYHLSSPYLPQSSCPLHVQEFDDWNPNVYRAPLRSQDHWREQQLLETLRHEQERRLWLLDEQRRARRAWEEEQLRRSLYEYEVQRQRALADTQAQKDRLWRQYKSNLDLNAPTVRDPLSTSTSTTATADKPIKYTISHDTDGRPIILFMGDPVNNATPSPKPDSPKVVPVASPLEEKATLVEPNSDSRSNRPLILAFVDDVQNPRTVLPVSMSNSTDKASLEDLFRTKFDLNCAPGTGAVKHNEQAQCAAARPTSTLKSSKCAPVSVPGNPGMVLRFTDDPCNPDGFVLGFREPHDSNNNRKAPRDSKPKPAKAENLNVNVSTSVEEVSAALAKFARIVMDAQQAVRADSKRASPSGSTVKDLEAINSQLKLLSSYQTRLDLITSSLDCLQIPKTDEFSTCRDLKRQLSARAVASAEEIETVARTLHEERTRLSCNESGDSQCKSQCTQSACQSSTDTSCACQPNETPDRPISPAPSLKPSDSRPSSRSSSPVRHVVLETVQDPDSS